MKRLALILLFTATAMAQGKVDLAHQVTGILPSANAGLGANASAFAANTVLQSNGGSPAIFQALALPNGLVKYNTTTHLATVAASSDITGLWSGSCSMSTFLRGDGTCAAAGAGTVTSIATTSPILGGTITTTGTISCQTADTSHAGCLTSTDWNTFNGKGSGTVTSVASLSFLGITCTVSNPTTTPSWSCNGSISGNTNVYGTTSGTLTSGHCVQFDANGNLVDAGAACGAGTVTSVSFTGGLISVANPTTTPAFTVAGTSGGIPYFSSASTWASSAALTANAPVIGGGAGTAPSVGSRSGNTTTFGTTSGSLTNGDIATFDASGNIVDGGSKIPAAANNCVPGSTGSIKALPIGAGLGSNGGGWFIWWGSRQLASASFQLQPSPIAGCLAYPALALRVPTSQQGSFFNFGFSLNDGAPSFTDQIGPGPFSAVGIVQDTWTRKHVNAYTAMPQIQAVSAGTVNSPNYFCCAAGWYPDDLITGIYGNDSDGNWSLGSGAAQFAGIGGRSTAASNTTEALVKVIMPDSYTASNLALMTNTTINVTTTLRQDPWNGSTNTGSVSTSLTATQSTNSGGLYVDSTHTVTGVERDALDLQYTQTAVGPTNFQFYTTLGIALASQGEGMLIWLMDETGVASATRFYPPFPESGHNVFSLTETDLQYGSPDSYTISHCYAWLNQAPTNATVISLSVNASTSGTPTVSTSGATGSIALSGSVAVSRKDKLTMKVVYPSTGTQPKISSITCRTS